MSERAQPGCGGEWPWLPAGWREQPGGWRAGTGQGAWLGRGQEGRAGGGGRRKEERRSRNTNYDLRVSTSIVFLIN